MTVLESAEVGSWEDPWESVPVIGGGGCAVLADPLADPRAERALRGSTEEVLVRCDGAGVPLEVVHRGRVHRVVEAPVRWFERRKWWDAEARAPRGSRTSLVDRELWQVQAARSAAGVAHTFRLVRHRAPDRWELLGVSSV